MKEHNSEHIKKSFAPLEKDGVNVLILGSIPGDKSIELGQYYGHPNNRFWRVISTICGCDFEIEYDRRKNILLSNNIALWDVAYKAIRPGSMDSAIKEEQPNKISDFIKKHYQIHTIAFNGKKAEQLYDKYFKRFENIRYLSLPSTSPANAACKIDELCSKWSQIFV